MAKAKEKFIIIDGNALIHRSFHALPPLATKDGRMVNAVYGFTSVLLKAIREFKPKYMAVAFDRKEKTFRHEEYKEYKATRVKAPDELYDQIPLVKEVASVLNIPIFEKAGFEADDLIGTLAKKVNGDIEKVIVTGDMDTLQLVDGQTKVFTMSRGLSDSVTYDELAVAERFGLKPEQMVDFKALRGDPSDNIPGVRGIGEKTAVELLKIFKTLAGVYKNIKSAKIKDRVRDLLGKHKKDAFLSRELARIKCDVDIKFSLEEARFGDFDRERAAELFSRLEFKSLLPRLQRAGADLKTLKGADKKEVAAFKFRRNLEKFKYQLIDSDREFEKFLAQLKKQKEFAFDTETATFSAVAAKLLGISFSWREGEAYYVNFECGMRKAELKMGNENNSLFNYQEKNKRSGWLEKLKPILEDEKIKKYGHNIKYDIEVMASYDIKVRGAAADSMIISYLLNPGSRQHGLDVLTFTEFNFQKITKDDLLGAGRDKITFALAPLEKLYVYSCEDADFACRLVKKMLPRLKKEKLDKLFYEMEMPLVEVLADMEKSGVRIDERALEKIRIKTKREIENLAGEIYKEAGADFNINSTQQLREILFEKLALPTYEVSKTKTGLSTGAEQLEKLKDLHPIIKKILKYRELAKLTNTYLDALPQLVSKSTGRLHTSFNQSVTATGRLSSTDPNLQNIPVRSDLGREIRKCFIAARGYKLLSLDYSQIELRLAAHMSGDKKMIKAFLDGEDIHRRTAAAINQVELPEVTDEMRRQAKAVNFGILYGQGPHGLSAYADIPYARAKEFIDDYFRIFKNVKKYTDNAINQARTKGYTETIYGRRRYLPEMNSSVMPVRKAAERMAINTPLQGSAADMIKAAMIEIHKHIKARYQEAEVKMILQVHDELLFEIKDNKVRECAAAFKKTMENIIKLNVPVTADSKAGNNWGEMEEQ